MCVTASLSILYLSGMRVVFSFFFLFIAGQYDHLFAQVIRKDFFSDSIRFPSVHAATAAETPEGIVVAWFGGSYEGASDVCIWQSRLEGNMVWSEPVMVADGRINDSTRYACYNPVLYYDQSGELLLFFKIGPNVAGWTGWMKRSNDYGKTWSHAEALPAGYLGPIKNKPLLVDGTLICPSSTEKEGWKIHFEYTDDLGRNWSRSKALNDPDKITAIQPAILDHGNGRLQALCRSQDGYINETWSVDAGKIWSPLVHTSLPNNNSGLDAVTLKDGRHLLVYNHVQPPPTATEGRGERSPLNIAVSKDGINWNAAMVLENDHKGEYSYPSVIATSSGKIVVVYTWRREKICFLLIDPEFTRTAPITNGQWPSTIDLH